MLRKTISIDEHLFLELKNGGKERNREKNRGNKCFPFFRKAQTGIFKVCVKKLTMLS